ncbi:VRR-NUC domain-containing protein [bacterium]|nr:VRR-NUC domain-containing protein [bacterium]
MAQTPEAKVKAKIKTILKEYGIYYAMPIGTGYGSSGVPDFLCCVNGKFVAIEAKAGKGEPTALQWKNLGDINKSGGYTCVINETNLDYLVKVIAECVQ